LLGAVSVFAIGFLQVDWSKWGDWSIVFVTGLASGLLYLMSGTDHIWVAYIGTTTQTLERSFLNDLRSDQDHLLKIDLKS
jgi:hypothetical protein